MKTEPLSPEDPRLTLYALDEMPAAEKVEFERLLAQDPAAQQIVAEIRAMAVTVTAALEQEPVETAKPAAKILRFPQAYFMISGLAAACFAVAFVLWQNEQELKHQSHLIEVPLAKVAEADNAANAQPPAPAAMPVPTVTLGRSEPPTAARSDASGPPAMEMKQAEVAAVERQAQVAQKAEAGRMLNRAVHAKQATAGAVADTVVAKEEPVSLAAFNVMTQAPAAPPPRLAKDATQTEAYAFRADNRFQRVADQPLSTFSIDVDTAAYANVRRFLSRNELPPADAVRIEEMVNYFPYDYAAPTNGQPFAANLEVAAAPWAPDHRLVRIGLKGRDIAEARQALAEQVGGTLVTIAKDVKIQVEFNPAQVQAYRLIGYENRLLAKEDFNNDKVDAGEIGAGHTVTALYEIVPVGAQSPVESPAVDGLKYQVVGDLAARAPEIPSKVRDPKSAELLTVKIRYKEPTGDVSSKLEFPLVDPGKAFADASGDFKFAAAVAGFGMVLRDSPHKGSLTLAQVVEWGRAGLGQDAGGYRAQFLSLVSVADRLLR